MQTQELTLADVKPNHQVSGAATAVTILDKALGQISSSQAKLGAIQNRLQHNIDNLSMASMLTETARGRVVDADFARETSELSKQQILGQAATSMLAQANQSKQSVSSPAPVAALNTNNITLKGARKRSLFTTQKHSVAKLMHKGITQ